MWPETLLKKCVKKCDGEVIGDLINFSVTGPRVKHTHSLKRMQHEVGKCISVRQVTSYLNAFFAALSSFQRLHAPARCMIPPRTCLNLQFLSNTLHEQSVVFNYCKHVRASNRNGHDDTKIYVRHGATYSIKKRTNAARLFFVLLDE